MMFKLMFLKKIYDQSDEKLISSAQTDMAYVSGDNLDICKEKGVVLFARTNTAAAAAASTDLDEGFSYNKETGRRQCPAGELAMRVEKRTAENGNTYLRYIFSKKEERHGFITFPL